MKHSNFYNKYIAIGIFFISCNNSVSENKRIEYTDTIVLDLDTPPLRPTATYVDLDSNYLREKNANKRYSTLPEFPGGLDSLNTFIADNLFYPSEIQGEHIGIMTEVEIDTIGQIINIQFGEAYGCAECIKISMTFLKKSQILRLHMRLRRKE